MNYTKVNVRKDLIEQIKIKAAADGRSITNYIEQLLLKDTHQCDRSCGAFGHHTEVNGLVPPDSEANTDSSNSPTEATQERKDIP